jgi:hypothetical protein
MAVTLWSSSRTDAVLMVLMVLACLVCLPHLWRGPHLRDWVVTGALSAVMLGWHLPMLTAPIAGSVAEHALDAQMQTGMVMAGAHGLHWTLALILVLVAVVEAGASVAAIIDALMSRRSVLRAP